MLLTIGHSNHSWERFLDPLARHGVRVLADIRRVPRSGRNPQFSGRELARALAGAGIAYRHFPGLGGMREPAPDSPNTAVLDAVFRGYADHMSTGLFARSLGELLDLAARDPVAAMCAEADPADCHRSYLADAAAARGAEVTHILANGGLRAHALSPLARIDGGSITYPGLFWRSKAKHASGTLPSQKVDASGVVTTRRLSMVTVDPTDTITK